jgi:tetratricopeptide (TPR) repeat protein
MIKYIKIMVATLIAATFIFGFSACEDYVNNIKAPINDVADEVLNTPEDVPFLITGVKTAWVITWDEHTLFTDGMADAFEFTRDIEQATYPTYEALDLADPPGVGVNPLIPDNNSTEAIYLELGRFRKHADLLIERVENNITFTDDNAYLKDMALYTGYFYGAVARYTLGLFWSLNPNDGGGGTIDVGPFIPKETLLNEALSMLDNAIAHASTDLETKYAHQLKARIYLYLGDYTNAKSEADMGMIAGDTPLLCEYNTVEPNEWYYWAGPGRTQFHAADRFGTYVAENPEEAGRLPLYLIEGVTDFTPAEDVVIGGVEYVGGETTKRKYIQQLKYSELGADIAFLTWQENTLMHAELAIRGNDNTTGLNLVNEVRASHGISALTSDDVTSMYGGEYLELIYVERDKELAFTGMRLIDQLRFNKWHLGADTWKRMPISKRERDANSNIN